MESECPIEVDPLGRNILGEAVEIRNSGPVVEVELPGGVVVWALTDPRLTQLLLSKGEVSADAKTHWTPWLEKNIPPDWPLNNWVAIPSAFTADGEEHKRLKELYSWAFSAQRVQEMTDTISDIISGLLDRLQSIGKERPGQVVDLREEYFARIPATVIGRLIGTDGEQFLAVVSEMFAAESGEDVEAAHEGMRTLLRALVKEKRERPGGDDMTTALVEARDRADTKLSEDELIATLWMLTAAGYDTTIGLLTQTAANIFSHPDQRELIREGRATYRDAVEETLRRHAPLPFRPVLTALEVICLDDICDDETGVTIRKGEGIVPHYAAIGLDQNVHGGSAEQWDIRRKSKGDHLAFGAGPHTCPAQPLARCESVLALEALSNASPTLSWPYRKTSCRAPEPVCQTDQNDSQSAWGLRRGMPPL